MNASRLLLAAALGLTLSLSGAGLSIAPSEKGALVKVDGEVFTEYVVTDEASSKPYLWPVFGPGQVSLSRSYPMENIKGEQHDHPHHRGIFFGHDNLAGADTWAEPSSFEKALKGKENAEATERLKKIGRLRHRSFTTLEVRDGSAVLVAQGDYLDPAGRKLFEEKRTLVFSVADGSRLIDVDIELIATEGPFAIADKKDGGLGIRIPTVLAADSKAGGRLVNSEGLLNEKVWGKRARWCDCNGPVGGSTMGVALLNHPSSFRFPTPWHARTYGLLAANPFGPRSLNPEEPSGDLTVKPGEPLKLFHRFIFHTGDEKAARIEEAWKTYAKLPKN